MIGEELDVKPVVAFYLYQAIAGVSLRSKMSAAKPLWAMARFKWVRTTL